MIVAVLGMAVGFKPVFCLFVVLSVISIIMILIFKPLRIANRDLVYRREAGLPEDLFEKIEEEAAELPEDLSEKTEEEAEQSETIEEETDEKHS